MTKSEAVVPFGYLISEGVHTYKRGKLPGLESPDPKKVQRCRILILSIYGVMKLRQVTRSNLRSEMRIEIAASSRHAVSVFGEGNPFQPGPVLACSAK